MGPGRTLGTEGHRRHPGAQTRADVTDSATSSLHSTSRPAHTMPPIMPLDARAGLNKDTLKPIALSASAAYDIIKALSMSNSEGSHVDLKPISSQDLERMLKGSFENLQLGQSILEKAIDGSSIVDTNKPNLAEPEHTDDISSSDTASQKGKSKALDY